MSNNPEPNSNHSNEPLPSSGRWTHLSEYELKFVKNIIKLYDEIMELRDDSPEIASRYELNVEEVKRAKDYAFGSGVSKYEFLPDEDMAAAWKRMAVGKGTAIDEVLLKHEILESELVVNQGINQKEAHYLAQQRYPWSKLI